MVHFQLPWFNQLDEPKRATGQLQGRVDGEKCGHRTRHPLEKRTERQGAFRQSRRIPGGE